MAYSPKTRPKDYIETLAFSCRELSQLGRGHDVTIYIERGLLESKRTGHSYKKLFAKMFVNHLIIRGVETGGAMVAVKGLRAIRKYQPTKDPTLIKECLRWAGRNGQFGLWRLPKLQHRLQREQKRSDLVQRLRKIEQELIDVLAG